MLALFAAFGVGCAEPGEDPAPEDASLVDASEEQVELSEPRLRDDQEKGNSLCAGWPTSIPELTLEVPIVPGEQDEWRGPDDRLPVTLSNQAEVARSVILRARLTSVGGSLERDVAALELDPGESAIVRVHPSELHPEGSLEPSILRLSAQLELALDVVREDGSTKMVALTELFLHTESGKLVAYSEAGLMNQGAGDLANTISREAWAAMLAHEDVRSPDAVVPIVATIRGPEEVRDATR